MDFLRIRGARQHNLQNVSCDIPRNRLVVITGVSGSGKSSLAFDTIFAEGQRRYVESLSAYARQFLEQMEKPDVDSIEGLSPAISIEQRTTSRNPRSTVGTVTEIYDYLRLLYASIGKPHCPKCGRRDPGADDPGDGGPRAAPAGGQPVRRPRAVRRAARRASTRSRWRRWSRRASCARASTARCVDLDDPPELDKQKKHTIEIVVDRLVAKAADDEEYRKRLADSIETATRVSGGLVIALGARTGPRRSSRPTTRAPTAARR